MADVNFDNVVIDVDNTKQVVLTSGKVYPIGQIVVSTDGTNYTDGAILASTEANYAKQEVLVLADEYNATTTAQTGIGYTGKFYRKNVKFATGQVEADVAGVLQAKNIVLEG